MFVTKTFKADRNRPSEMLTPNDTSGELIDQLIGICFAEPPYLRKADAMRHVSLLNELKAFECVVMAQQGKSKALLKNLSIRRLPFVLEQWVSSYFEKSHHPMMPAYVMDTGRLLEFHVAGYRYENPSHKSDSGSLFRVRHRIAEERRMRGCPGARASRDPSGSKEDGQPDSAVVGSVGFGALPDPAT